jgi:Short C-terminal domain
MKIFRRNQHKDKVKVEKPIVTYWPKYIGVLGSNKSLPVEERANVHIYEDRIGVELLKSKFRTVIQYKNMTDIENVDAGNKVDLERVIGLGVLTAGIGSIVGLLWKRHHIITVIKYTDDALLPQSIALDFLANTKYAQPIIYNKMREAQQTSGSLSKPPQDTNQPVVSFADELSKLAKLKEQGVITEEEFSQMKNNLMKRMGD